MSPAALLAIPPRLYFRGELSHCPRCGCPLKVWKTQIRRPVTLHLGAFVAHETVLHCDRCPDTLLFHSAELAGLVAPGRTFGYDVMIHAGEAVLRRNLTIEETVAELSERNIRISASEVRELVARFIVSLGIAHAEAAPRLRRCLRQAGGYILHLDSTCKGGSAHLLTGIDEISGFVLLNAKIPSESGDEIRSFLRKLIKRFGRPVAVSSDMSRGILAAIATELKSTPVFICHFHFLRDIGKDLMAQDYDTIRKCLRHHGLRAQLRRLQCGSRDVVGSHGGALKSLLAAIESGQNDPVLACGLSHEALLGVFTTSILEAEDQGDGCGFPFDRPHLLFLRQAQAVMAAVETLLRGSLSMDKSERRQWQRFVDMLRPTCTDSTLVATAASLEEKIRTFDQLRRAMRIAEPGTGAGLNDPGVDVPIRTIEHNVDAFCRQLRADKTRMSRKSYVTMLEQIDQYRGMLFADPIRIRTQQGVRMLQPQRTNNILERFFRDINRSVCKRTGHGVSESFINRMLPDTPLIANLDNPKYVEILLDDCETLVQRLARIDQKQIDMTLTELRRPMTGLDRKVRARLRNKATPAQIVNYVLVNMAQSN